jgi:PhnB protein
MTDRPAHVPAGHATLAPYVMAQGARDLVAFLTQVFDARVVMSLDRDDGSLMHASLQIGESSLMLAEATADYPAFPVWLHVYVADAGETYAKAIALGATGIEAPVDKGDGDRRGGFRDACGNTWWVATPSR